MIKKLVLLLMLTLSASPAFAAYVSGVDDETPDRPLKITAEQKKILDDSILTYYQDSNSKKIDALLDLIADSVVLDRKTASPPLVGFLTVVFEDNKDQVFSWMSRNDYYPGAQYVIVNALLHAKLKEAALLFAKAHKWEADDIYRLRETDDTVNLKKLEIVVPGHIDTLWGAFFASGDPIYVEQIIDAAMAGALPKFKEADYFLENQGDALAENKMLAANTLRDYAREHPVVREALEKRLKAEPDSSPKKKFYQELLGK